MLTSSKSTTVLGRRRLTVKPRFEDGAIDISELTTARHRQVDDGLTALLCSASIVLARRDQSLVFRFVECDLESPGLSVNGKKRMGRAEMGAREEERHRAWLMKRE